MELTYRTEAVKARHKANKLLREFLTDEQWADWCEDHGFNVKASDGLLYRINAHLGAHHSHGTLVRDTCNSYGRSTIGTCCWAQGLEYIPADQALAVLMYLWHSPSVAWDLGCHESVFAYLGPKHHAHKYKGGSEQAA